MEDVYQRAVSGKRIYLDNNATTQPTKEVVDMLYVITTNAWGNPSGLYTEGAVAREELNKARKVHAEVMAVPPETVYFTSCGTESNNIALRSVMCKAMKAGRNVLITSEIEHPSINNTADFIQCKHVQAPVNGAGVVDPVRFRDLLIAHKNAVGMISIIMAHNEFGTIQNVANLASIARSVLGGAVPFHTDATQMFGKYVLHPQELGVDMMTASAHKYHGPRGVGILYSREGLVDPAVTPMSGGGQERGCRSGTENVAAIAAATTALLQSVGDPDVLARKQKKMQELRDMMEIRLYQSMTHGILFNGDRVNRLCNTLSVTLPGGVKGPEMVAALDKLGIAIGSGSACSKGKASKALTAIYKAKGFEEEEAAAAAHSSIRITLNRFNTAAECEYAALQILKCWTGLNNK